MKVPECKGRATVVINLILWLGLWDWYEEGIGELWLRDWQAHEFCEQSLLSHCTQDFPKASKDSYRELLGRSHWCLIWQGIWLHFCLCPENWSEMEVKKQWTVCFAEGISRKHDRLQCGYCTLHLLRFKVCKRAEDRVETGNMQSGGRELWPWLKLKRGCGADNVAIIAEEISAFKEEPGLCIVIIGKVTWE